VIYVAPYGAYHPASSDGKQIIFLPHALPIVCAGLFLALLALLLWNHHRQFVHQCTCQKGTDD
jgi:hypothetical protein